MIKETNTVLLIEDSPEYAELVQRWLSDSSETKFILNWSDSIETGLKRLEQGGIDVVLLDLGLPDSSGYETFRKTRNAAPEVSIVLLSGDDSELMALRMIQNGAQDYISKSKCSGEDLQRAIRYALARSENSGAGTGRAASHAPAIGVVGARGGVGVTSIACSLGLELQRQTSDPTLLLDLDVDSGLAGFLTNVESKYSILDAVENLHRLDSSYWRALVAKHPTGLEIMPSPRLHGLGELGTDKLRDLLSFLRNHYRWIVLDLGRLSKQALDLLDKTDEICLVTSTSIPSLFEVKRTITSLEEAGFDDKRLRLVVNHMSDSDFAISDLNRFLGTQVYGALPYAPGSFQDSSGLPCLPAEISHFRAAITGLARKLAGLPEIKQRGAVSRFTSLALGLASSIAPGLKAKDHASPVGAASGYPRDSKVFGGENGKHVPCGD